MLHQVHSPWNETLLNFKRDIHISLLTGKSHMRVGPNHLAHQPTRQVAYMWGKLKWRDLNLRIEVNSISLNEIFLQLEPKCPKHLALLETIPNEEHRGPLELRHQHNKIDGQSTEIKLSKFHLFSFSKSLLLMISNTDQKTWKSFPNVLDTSKTVLNPYFNANIPDIIWNRT